MMKRNYQKELEEKINHLEEKPKLLLHCCCAPCSSYTLEYLASYFHITVFFYNPNITEIAEYERRREEELRFLGAFPFLEKIGWLEAEYRPKDFFMVARGLENEPEGGERCSQCFKLRLQETAKAASENGFDYFCTTLSISPYKNAEKLMEIGEHLARQYDVRYLPSDFKKRDGYRRSVGLSKEYGLYRQDYCGCIFSKRERGKK